MLPLLASAIPALAGLVAGPAALATGIGSAIKQANDNPGSQTWLGSATDELFNGGANRINLAESQAARAQQQAQYNQNMAFQREQFDYQKQLNDLQIQREDTAAQRQVADMRAAGISPLAQFSSASTGSLSGSGFSGPSASPVAGSASPISLISGVAEIAQMIQSLQMNKAQIQKTKAETAGILGNNQFSDDTYATRVLREKLITSKSESELQQFLYNDNYMRLFGITPSMSEKERLFQIIKHLGSFETTQSSAVLDEELFNRFNGSTTYTDNGFNVASFIKNFAESLGLDVEKAKDNPLIQLLIKTFGLSF